VGLPAPLSPLLQVRPLGAEGGVAAVAGVDPGLVGQDVEHLRGDITKKRGETLRVVLRVPNPARECQGLSRVNTGFGCGGVPESRHGHTGETLPEGQSLGPAVQNDSGVEALAEAVLQEAQPAEIL
jgi:hypothetical protein